MADSKISALTALAGTDFATGDLVTCVDVSDTSMAGSGTNKSMTASELLKGLATVSSGTTLGSGFTLNNGSITTSQPVLDLSQTWNDGAVAFTGLKFNATDTASATASLFLDLRLGGTSKCTIDKYGAMTFLNLTAYDQYQKMIVVKQNGTEKAYFRGDGFVAAQQLGTADNVTAFFYQNAFSNHPKGIYLAEDAGLSWSTTTNAFAACGSVLIPDSDNVLALRNSTNAQTFNIYNTTDAGVTNYERGFMRWNSNVLEIGAEAAGTGTARDLKIIAGSGTIPLTIANAAMSWSVNGYTSFSNTTVGGHLRLSATTLHLSPNNNNYEWTLSTAGFITPTGNNSGITVGGRINDNATVSFTLTGAAAWASASTNIVGGDIVLTGGAGASGSASNAHGGHIYLDGGQGYGTGDHGGIYFAATRGRISYFNATPVAQQSGTGETTGFTAGAGTAVLDDSTFTGNVGSTAYRINDIVKALKNYGLLAA